MNASRPSRAFDLHCHIDLFPDPATEIGERDRHQVVTLAVTTTPRAWSQNAAWTGNSRYVRAALGLHPELVAERFDELALLESLMQRTSFVGEIGLDGSSQHRSTLPIQRKAFRSILAHAESLGGRVLSIHSRGAVDLVLEDLEGCTTRGRVLPILHWFSGSQAAAQRASKIGCFFSVNPRTLDHESGEALVRTLPADRLLTETDAPFVTADIGAIPLVVERLAEVRGIPKDQMLAAVASNTSRVFAFTGDQTGFFAATGMVSRS